MVISEIVGGLLYALIGSAYASWLTQEFDSYGDKKSLFTRSKCDHCKKTLKWYNLIPIFSYIFQIGRSSCCKNPLSSKYLVTELTTALLFIYIFLNNEFLAFGILIPLLFLLIFVDERHKEIPIWLNGLILIWVLLNFNFSSENLITALIVAITLLLISFIFEKIKNKSGLGLGDIILLFSISLYFGFPTIAYLISISSGALLLKIILTREYKEQHAFGSWLAGGFILLILFQEFYVSAS
jgi:prepilin signal peptidase PulO-like enzyme (type II secretory pathway)